MEKENSTQLDGREIFEFSGTLTYSPEVETMRVDVESLEGQWPFGANRPATVRITARCVRLAVETRSSD